MRKKTKIGNLLAVGTVVFWGSAAYAQVDNATDTEPFGADNTITGTDNTVTGADNTLTDPGFGTEPTDNAATGAEWDEPGTGMNDATDTGYPATTDTNTVTGTAVTTTTEDQTNWGWLGLLGLAGLAGLLRKPEQNETVHHTTTPPSPH